MPLLSQISEPIDSSERLMIRFFMSTQVAVLCYGVLSCPTARLHRPYVLFWLIEICFVSLFRSIE